MYTNSFFAELETSIDGTELDETTGLTRTDEDDDEFDSRLAADPARPPRVDTEGCDDSVLRR
jgi:hypothetical protein